MDKQMYYTPSLFLDIPQKVWTPFKQYDHIIFENGQGIMLDGCEDNNIETSTPSATTLNNPRKIADLWCSKFAITFTVFNIVYVTRTYYTRHGKGDLTDELDVSYLETSVRIFDKTNIPNEWQGPLRYGSMSGYNSDLKDSVSKRVMYHDTAMKRKWDKYSVKEFKTFLFITHADEVSPCHELWKLCPTKDENYNKDGKRVCNSGIYMSNGPRRGNVREFKYWEDLY